MISITFTVRDPISVNRMYGKSHKIRRMFITSEGRAFKHRVIAAAMLARANSAWPADPFVVAKARVSYDLYDYRGDTDGPAKAVRDCLEKVLYMNDRTVEDGPHPLPVKDGQGRRIVITVELLEQRTPEQAEAERQKHRAREAANAKRRAKATAS